MRVLVTRPRRDAERTASRLAALGHEALIAPLIEIVATGAQPSVRAFDAVFATSAQAIDFLDPALARALRELPLFVVGERTAAAARVAKFADVRPAAADSRRLAEAIVAAYAGSANFLYLAGRDRKPDLETTLTSVGHTIEAVTVYEARAVVVLPQQVGEALRTGQIDAVLHYSFRSAAIFRDLVESAGFVGAARLILHVCLSENIAAALRNFAPQLAMAHAPNEAAMMTAIDDPSVLSRET